MDLPFNTPEDISAAIVVPPVEETVPDPSMLVSPSSGNTGVEDFVLLLQENASRLVDYLLDQWKNVIVSYDELISMLDQWKNNIAFPPEIMSYDELISMLEQWKNSIVFPPPIVSYDELISMLDQWKSNIAFPPAIVSYDEVISMLEQWKSNIAFPPAIVSYDEVISMLEQWKSNIAFPTAIVSYDEVLSMVEQWKSNIVLPPAILPYDEVLSMLDQWKNNIAFPPAIVSYDEVVSMLQDKMGIMLDGAVQAITPAIVLYDDVVSILQDKTGILLDGAVQAITNIGFPSGFPSSPAAGWIVAGVFFVVAAGERRAGMVNTMLDLKQPVVDPDKGMTFSELQDELVSLEESLGVLLNETEELIPQVEYANEKLYQREEELLRIVTEAGLKQTKLDERIRALESEEAALLFQTKQLEGQVEKSRQDRDSLEDSLERTWEKLTYELLSMEEQVGILRDETAVLSREVEDTNERISNRDDELLLFESLPDQKELELDERLRELESEEAFLVSQTKELEGQVEKSRRVRASLEDALERITDSEQALKRKASEQGLSP